MATNSPSRDQLRQAARHRRQLRARRRRWIAGIAGIGMLAILAVGLAALLDQGSGGTGEAASQQAASWDAPAFTDGPRLAVDQTIIDHGSVAYGHEVEASYRLKNVGDQPLRIENPEVTILDGC